MQSQALNEVSVQLCCKYLTNFLLRLPPVHLVVMRMSIIHIVKIAAEMEMKMYWYKLANTIFV